MPAFVPEQYLQAADEAGIVVITRDAQVDFHTFGTSNLRAIPQEALPLAETPEMHIFVHRGTKMCILLISCSVKRSSRPLRFVPRRLASSRLPRRGSPRSVSSSRCSISQKGAPLRSRAGLGMGKESLSHYTIFS